MKNNKKKKFIYDWIIHLLFLLALLSALLFFGIYQSKLKKNQYIDSWSMTLNKGWYQLFDDGSMKPVSFPIHEEDDMQCTYVNKIPEGLKPGAQLAFYSGQDIKVYIGGELRYEYYSNENPLNGEIVKSIIHQVPINEEDYGKELKITKCDPTGKNGNLSMLLIGDSLGIYRHLFSVYGIKMIAALLLMILAFIAIVLNIMLNKKFNSNEDAISLALGILLVSFWAVCDNVLFQYVFQTTYIDGVMSFILTLLLPFPFIFYMNRVQKKRYHTIYHILEGILVISFIIFSYLHFFTEYSFMDNLMLLDTVIGVSAVATTGTIVHDLIKKQDTEYHDLSLGYIGLCFFGVLEVINLNLTYETSTKWDGVFIIVGMYFLLYKAILLVLRKIGKAQIEVAEALRASEMKSSFLANMSHEIRTPINAILGMNEMILRESSENAIKNYASDVDASGKMLLNIVNDILDFSKVESGKMELIPVQYELKELVDNIVSMLSSRIQDKGLLFNVNVNRGLPNYLCGDELRVRQIITNLITNSIKYTDKGEITLSIDGDWKYDLVELKISVKDTGKGIKEEDMGKLFDSFTRVDERKNRNIEGTGLGLALVKKLSAMMGGNVDVSSEYGKGSTFTVTIKQEVMEKRVIGNYAFGSRKIADEAMPDKKAVEKKQFFTENCRVLIVDDVEMNCKVMGQFLKNTGMELSFSLSGFDAFDKCKETKYDLIFMDHMMPEIDGIETYNKLKTEENLNNETPVIILTANAIAGSKEKYLEEGFSDYLSKPVVYKDLEEKLITWLPKEKIV